MNKKEENRFAKFNPLERDVIRILLQNHANSVSEIALYRDEVYVASYLAVIEALEKEVTEA